MEKKNDFILRTNCEIHISIILKATNQIAKDKKEDYIFSHISWYWSSLMWKGDN